MEHTMLDYVETNGGAKCQPLSTLRPEKVVSILDGSTLLKHEMELTITFRDDWLETYSIRHIQKSVYNFMAKQSKKYGFRYFLVQDYSKTLRLHYHGCIVPRDGTYEELTRLRLSIQRKFGRTELKPIGNDKQYHAYMMGLYITTHEKYNPHIKWSIDRMLMDSLMYLDIFKQV